uniref:Sterile alpha motif domain containing 13 n=1 Tax=Otus sunia TaxID=257818 RepID=A0A8C8AXC2_9STRI
MTFLAKAGIEERCFIARLGGQTEGPCWEVSLIPLCNANVGRGEQDDGYQAVGAVEQVAEVKETSILPMLTVDMENKENGSLDVKNSVENGRPPDPADWAVIDVVNYFRTAGFEEQANAFQEQVLDLLHLDPAKLEAVLPP